ncbi:hypothetical protein LUZ60_005333 [Juncus effusus]|nr:hypothetical protein LUZ60_005333 [Juncus effusus]
MAGGKSKKVMCEKKTIHVPEVVTVERAPFAARLTCPLCDDIYEEATTITLCLHTFCRKCIVEKLQEEENCPVCDVHIGATPSDKLRPDYNIQSLREKFFPPKSTQPEQANSSESVLHAESSVEAQSADPTHELEVNDSPHRPAQTRRHRKKGGKKKGSAHHRQGPVINEPVVEKEGKQAEENQEEGHELASSEIESSSQSKEKECSDNSEIVKPLNSLALSKGKEKEKDKHDTGSSGTTGNMSGTVTGTGTGVLTGQPERKFTAVWFSLVASHDPDGSMTVAYIQKYLAQKLSLSDESEVEVVCQNLPVSPAVSMYDLVELWLQTPPKQKIRASVGQSAEKFMMVLHYRKAKNN